MKAVVLQAVVSEFFQGWHDARSTKGARVSKADIIDQDHDNVWCSFGGFDIPTRRSLGVPCIELFVER